jgi:hypothetical protein
MAIQAILEQLIWTPDRKCTVYRIRNTINGRCYVGSTFDVEYRWYMRPWTAMAPLPSG